MIGRARSRSSASALAAAAGRGAAPVRPGGRACRARLDGLGTALIRARRSVRARSLPGLWLPYWLTPFMHLASQTVFPAAILVCVLRNRMWGLRLVVSRARARRARSPSLLLVGSTSSSPCRSTRCCPGDGVPQLLAAGLVAVAVQPVRSVAAARVHRLVYGDAADPGARSAPPRPAVRAAPRPTEQLGGSRPPTSASMRLESGHRRRPTGLPRCVGLRRPGRRAVELLHRGEVLGHARGDGATRRVAGGPHPPVARRTVVGGGGGGRRRPRSPRALQELRGPARLRAAGGAAGDPPRNPRRARSLAGGYPTRSAGRPQPARLRPRRRGGADRTPAGATRGGHGRRRAQLSHSMFPPVLDELGLVPALHRAGRPVPRQRTRRLACEADRLDDLDPELAAAAYGIASEAAHQRRPGTRRRRLPDRRASHSPAPDAHRRTTTAAGSTGRAAPGVGTRSMRERAHEQGGTLHIGPPVTGGGDPGRALPLPIRERRHGCTTRDPGRHRRRPPRVPARHGRPAAARSTASRWPPRPSVRRRRRSTRRRRRSTWC